MFSSFSFFRKLFFIFGKPTSFSCPKPSELSPGRRFSGIFLLPLLLLPLSLSGCAGPASNSGAFLPFHTEPPPHLTKVSFADFPSLSRVNFSQSLQVFRKACRVLLKLPADRPLGGSGLTASLAGTPADWQTSCRQALQINAFSDRQAEQFFTNNFTPYKVNAPTRISGYYEPETRGSLYEHNAYRSPLAAKPDNLVTQNLNNFFPGSGNRILVGRIRNGHFIPYDTRAEIISHILAGQSPALVWVADPVAAYLIEAEGMGKIILPDNQVLQIIYETDNGRQDIPIGRILLAKGLITGAQNTPVRIRQWLYAHQTEAKALFSLNPYYPFFRTVPETGKAALNPPGALGVSLTPEISAASDPEALPLGTPLLFFPNGTAAGQPPSLLLVEDFSAGLNGIHSLNLFTGTGAKGLAALQKLPETGQLIVLLPNSFKESVLY